ncbi:uncharacterized protein APUU_20484A [Aspergillus puulaauensis]|uniref:Uncharacterized protein n=1 Tax=Aspergillus puulaauensis TaxID=1220207 RepID=A0A7R8AJ10_9EURO|nr:uncharacterized protein APUU_20484A [Aspergillus puulaauensis]BCS20052.1 hypothetical protein APUU_20484A [Aspergillus puulaauensis]
MQRIAQLPTGAKVLLKKQPLSVPARCIFSTPQLQVDSNTDKEAHDNQQPNESSKRHSTPEHHKPRKAAKSVAQEDEELRRRLEEMSGEGGASGIEYEDGKPQTMKRSVRNNMFRYI